MLPHTTQVNKHVKRDLLYFGHARTQFTTEGGAGTGLPCTAQQELVYACRRNPWAR